MKRILPVIGIAAGLVSPDALAATSSVDTLPAAEISAPVISSAFANAVGEFARSADQFTRVAQTWASSGGYQKGQPYVKGPSQGYSKGAFTKFIRTMRKQSMELPGDRPDGGNPDVKAVFQLHKPA